MQILSELQKLTRQLEAEVQMLTVPAGRDATAADSEASVGDANTDGTAGRN